MRRALALARLAALAAAAGLCAGCAGGAGTARAPAPPAAAPSAPSNSPEAFAVLAARFTDRALELARAGELRRARAAWEAVAALRPGAAEPGRQAAELTARLGAEAACRYRAGLARRAAGDADGARREFLLALRADPADVAALEAFRAGPAGAEAAVTVAPGESFESLARLLWGDAGLGTLLARVNGLDPGADPAPGTVLSVPEIPYPASAGPCGGDVAPPPPGAAQAPPAPPAPVQPPKPASPAPAPPATAPDLARVAPATEPSAADRERADELYNAGVRHFVDEDLEAAIRSWERALRLNPAHPSAARDIETARELQRKLREIR